MAEKRYQIFVSSTYSDLRDERQKIFFAIMMLNHIPAGMEFFGAVDEEQMEFIQRVIVDSDYYVLLLGARYGSLDENGVSYTEREFNYAVSMGVKVIALLHENPDVIPQGKTDKNDELRRKFMAFRDRVMGSKRLISFWNNTEELTTKFQASLIQSIQRHPSIGWMRGDSLASAELLRKVAELELENQRLREQLKNIGAIPIATDVKMEAVSITNPDCFSDSEVECVSIDLKIQGKEIPHLFIKAISPYNTDDMTIFLKKAIPWFQKMVKICRFDLKISNPNLFLIENMDAEEHLFVKDGTELKIFNYGKLDEPPIKPLSDNYKSNSSQKSPATDLNPKQSTLYTHHRLFIPEKDMICSYQRIIFAKNIVEPIVKTIIIKYRVMSLELSLTKVISIISELESQKKFNDIGVFDYVTTLLQSQDSGRVNEN